MASSSGSLETTGNSRGVPFSFSAQFSTSFTDLLRGNGDDDKEDRLKLPQASGGFSDRNSVAGSASGGGLSKFKSQPPPSLPISPPPISPSSYFNMPLGLSPSELLDSPVLLSSSNVTSQLLKSYMGLA